MVMIGVLFLFLMLPAAIAIALAFGLARLQSGWSLRRRTILSALSAGFLPMAIPIFAALTDFHDAATIPALLTLVTGGLVMAVVIGLPIALVIGRKLAPAPIDPSTFD